MQGQFHKQTLYVNTVEHQTHPCVFWYQSALMRLEVRMTTLKPSSYHSNIIFLHKGTQQLSALCNINGEYTPTPVTSVTPVTPAL